MTTTLALAALAVLLLLGAPVLLPRLTRLRRTPAAGLLLWQASALGGLIALTLLPLVAVGEWRERAGGAGGLDPVVSIGAWALTALLVARLLWAAHHVGSDLRAIRRRHRELLDLLDPSHSAGDRLRVIDSGDPVAWCLPGRRARIVMSTAALEELTDEELHGVYHHERAHLRHRHDLVMEFLTVVTAAVPHPVQHPRALAEPSLLVELLADRRAARVVGSRAMGRALVRLGLGPHPAAPGGVLTGFGGSGATPAAPAAQGGRAGRPDRGAREGDRQARTAQYWAMAAAAPLPEGTGGASPALVRLEALGSTGRPRTLQGAVVSLAAVAAVLGPLCLGLGALR
ncbi:Zn-dependent protease with chaperone function [Kytococcus aerolatus]|uniref:Zn-dependent protease with chaperone function n=1 Tax=Kytococcus aerolatus TaxID=592308 RepID=A0A212TFE5_9MICO|nr:M56 family metallopeptidase [Kytococcus aerolatus]SNC64546.1 Zn-dependent protease with chaperone function [Kytococcus aerolatus]